MTRWLPARLSALFSSTRLFPALQHLPVSCNLFLRQLQHVQLPQLSSLTAHGSMDADLGHLTSHAFCICFPKLNGRDILRLSMHQILQRAPRSMKRLSIADGNIVGAHTDRVEHIFPPPAVALATLSSLVYLDFLHGTTIADWRYLLTAASRPCFAAQLTHLALRMQ